MGGALQVIYPHGKVADSLSVYLEVADVYVLPDWNRCVRFTLSVLNQDNPKYTVKRDSWRTFMDGNPSPPYPHFCMCQSIRVPPACF